MGVGVIFPGQGTQAAGMGVPWRATAAWEVVERAEAALGEPLGHLLLDATEAALGRTREAQLAVFLQSLLAWEAVRPLVGTPVAFAGHSLGQLTALVASGALALDDGIRLVAARARATQDAADARPGRMVALLGIDLEAAEAACREAGPAWVANDNAPGQVVVGGTHDAVDRAAAAARERGARRILPLNVGGAFHTPLMEGAASALEPHLAVAAFRTPRAPVVSNVDGQAWGDAGGWRSRLAEQLVSPVRWRSCLLTLEGLGADALIEVGPGRILAGLARRTVPDLPVHGVSVPAELAVLAMPAPMEVA